MRVRCCWHLMKNITTRIKDAAVVGALQTLMYSSDSATNVEKEYTSLIDKITLTDPTTATYITENFYSQRKQFWHCYTFMHCTLGAQSTQRIESYHAQLKHSLNKATSLSALYDEVCGFARKANDIRKERERQHSESAVGPLSGKLVLAQHTC
jgi:hypothetical protein